MSYAFLRHRRSLARGQSQHNIARNRGLLLLSQSDRTKVMEVVDFEADAIRNSRPLSAQVRRSETYSVSRRPQSSKVHIKRWKNSSANGLQNPFSEKNRFSNTKKSVYAVKGQTHDRKRYLDSSEERRIAEQNDNGIAREAALVDSFWPVNMARQKPMLPTVSAENIEIEKKLSRYIPKLSHDLGDKQTERSLLQICRLYRESVQLMNRDLQRISDQTVSVECAQQSMYCVGHMNLISQIHECLKDTVFNM